MVGLLFVSAVPSDDVAETPVIPITSAGESDPTEGVADTPVTPITSAG